jgi:hypothetical protein
MAALSAKRWAAPSFMLRISTPKLSPMRARLANRRLYIADMAGRLAAMESRVAPLEALTYRVLAKRLREAAAGFPDVLLSGFGACDPIVGETLENRFFDAHGVLCGDDAALARRRAAELFVALGVRLAVDRPRAAP